METSDMKLKDNPLLSVVGKRDKNKDKALSNLKLKPKGKRKKHDSSKIESVQTKCPVLPPVSTLIDLDLDFDIASKSIIQKETEPKYTLCADYDEKDTIINILHSEEENDSKFTKNPQNNAWTLQITHADEQTIFENDKQKIYK